VKESEGKGVRKWKTIVEKNAIRDQNEFGRPNTRGQITGRKKNRKVYWSQTKQGATSLITKNTRQSPKPEAFERERR